MPDKQSGDAPVYGIRPHKPGMYLGLFHGRDTPHEAMNEWGFDGPALGCSNTFTPPTLAA
jgi:hypothetical protein